ncbi:hypothetical protein GCM10007880_64750 [Mesorhizobium amorphae]|nr:hypothetical protein GCM10007880_64750 [Mesorhizobium amorphae]
MRERSALSELSNMDAKRDIAALATQHASRDLAIAEDQRARAEVELYQQLVSLDALSVAALDRRCQLLIERLATEVTLRHQRLDDARIAQEEAETAASEARAHWVKCSAAKHKWEQIDDDIGRAADTHLEAAAEIEAEDEILLRYGSVSRAKEPGDVI